MACKTKGYGQRGMRREIEGGREGIVDRGRDELREFPFRQWTTEHGH